MVLFPNFFLCSYIIAQEDDDFLDSLSDEGKSVCTVDEGDEDSDKDVSIRSKREVREDLQSKVCLHHFYGLFILSFIWETLLELILE